MKTILQVRQHIKFALAQLGSQNGHHIFEHMARDFARHRICRNILPATGPVGAGGDQGRDFETYNVCPELEGTTVFSGTSKSGSYYFACSIQEKIFAKIKSDIKEIFLNVSDIRDVIYFCTEDVPIGKRNKLKKWCFDTYKSNLEIFDGEALAENLSDRDIWWIAVEYLNVPSDIYPTNKQQETWYGEYRSRWIEGKRQPVNFSDFCEIKYGLREATHKDDLKPDLIFWLDIMKKFFTHTGSHLVKKSQYEICVAALRGNNNLDKYKDVLEDFFKDIKSIEDVTDLEDTTVLLSYCSTAKIMNHLNIEASYLHQLSVEVVKIIESFLKNASGANVRCAVLSIRAHAAILQYLEGETAYADIEEAFKWWKKLANSAEEAPLFPLERFADMLTKLTEFFGDDDRFQKLTSKVDDLLTKRTGTFIAAEKCRDRAIAYYDAGNFVQAIEHLHRAKINWFSAETLRPCILSFIFLAECYEKLGLCYAAKYCSLSAAYLAFQSKEKDVYDLISRSLFKTAEQEYAAGEWLGFLQTLKVALISHHHYDKNPLHVEEHEDLQRVLFYMTVIKYLTKRFWQPVENLVEAIASELALDDDLKSALDTLMDEQPKDSYWKSASLDEVWKQIEENLHGRPFVDVGLKRTIEWSSLGISWKVVFENKFETVRLAEEFIALLQILIVELAKEDLQLLPVKNEINISESKDGKYSISEVDSNDKLEWHLSASPLSNTSGDILEDRKMQIVSAAFAIIGKCTTLDYKSFKTQLEKAFKEGLFGKGFFVRPYPEAYAYIMTQELFEEMNPASLSAIEDGRAFQCREHPNTSWKKRPGKFYDESLAIEHVTNRYRRLKDITAIVWPKIVASPAHKDFFRTLKSQGYLDWHLQGIACNIFVNYWTSQAMPADNSSSEYMKERMRLTNEAIGGKFNTELAALSIADLEFSDLDIQAKASVVSIMKTWELVCNMQTPNFDAIIKFMRDRYYIFDTDIEHTELTWN